MDGLFCFNCRTLMVMIAEERAFAHKGTKAVFIIRFERVLILAAIVQCSRICFCYEIK
jgi:hypothetical protein